MLFRSVSKNTALAKLDCNNTQLTSLDISKNMKLEYLNVSKNSDLNKIYVWQDFDIDNPDNTLSDYEIDDHMKFEKKID